MKCNQKGSGFATRLAIGVLRKLEIRSRSQINERISDFVGQVTLHRGQLSCRSEEIYMHCPGNYMAFNLRDRTEPNFWPASSDGPGNWRRHGSCA